MFSVISRSIVQWPTQGAGNSAAGAIRSISTAAHQARGLAFGARAPQALIVAGMGMPGAPFGPNHAAACALGACLVGGFAGWRAEQIHALPQAQPAGKSGDIRAGPRL